MEEHSQALSFAFFAASREKNLLAKLAPNCGYTPRLRNESRTVEFST
jgi:hypothetical protein